MAAPWVDAAGSFEVPDENCFISTRKEEQDSCLMRAEYLPPPLKISHTPNATDVHLLNPLVVTADGEWEARYLAHWLPGAVCYRSFGDLMNAEYAEFRGAE